MTPVPWHDVALDFLTDLPTRMGIATLMVIVYRFSKMLILVPLLGDASVDSVFKAFSSEVVKRHGLPRTVILDQDPWFLSNLWTGILHIGHSWNSAWLIILKPMANQNRPSGVYNNCCMLLCSSIHWIGWTSYQLWSSIIMWLSNQVLVKHRMRWCLGRISCCLQTWQPY